MEEKRVRISDIAQELGLSTATVSNVLHGKTKKVSEETVRRVQAALEEHQYIPSMAGILLAQNTSRIIGVVVNDHEKYESHVLSDPYIASALDCLSTQIEGAGLFMMVKKAKEPGEIIRFASMWNLEGLVLMGFCDEDYGHLRAHMRIPFVVYDGCGATERVCNITVDNFSGGAQVGRHFGALGHKKALCVSDNDVFLDHQRFEGFRSDFPGEAELLLVPMEKEARLAFYREHLERFRAVTAVFAVSDYYALELMEFLRTQGLRVPEDIALAGFDDTPMAALASLTSVRQDVSLRAKLAVEQLRALKEGRETEDQVMLPVRLIARGSSQN
ncbi:MAG: LacI family DNA-binding transcriptional regulator [Oscillibacter sp.]|nr:LacI family DNA-binding transcriptional regulator [Oscillibacter sp.]